jgi:hypothetical protein
MILRILAVCAVLLSSCAQRPTATRVNCPPIEGVEQVLSAPGVFIGDMHGTKEAPGFLAALACHAVQANHEVVVAMEYDARDQAVLEQFLATGDEEQASRLLTATPFWQQNMDGRGSAAMRDALLQMRRLGNGGGSLELVAYDFGGATSQERENSSAALLEQHRARHAGKYWIVFGGNVHARKTRGLEIVGAPPGSENHEPLGYQLQDWNLIHLNVYYRGGSMWGCMGPPPDGCSILNQEPSCSADCPSALAIRLTRIHPSYDGVYDVGSLTASPPLHLQ